MKTKSFQNRVEKKSNHAEKHAESKVLKCALCQENHRISKCQKYKDKTPKERLTFVKEKKLCFNCLKGHARRSCPSKLSCFSKDCNKNHHTTLHDAFVKENGNNLPKEDNKDTVKGADSTKNKDVKINHLQSRKYVYLRVVPVRIQTQEKFADTYALLDEGSQTTIIRSDLAESLNLPGDHKLINLGGLKDEGEMVQGRSVSFTLKSRDGSFKYDVNEAFAIAKEQFNMPSQHLPKNFQTSEKWKYLQGLEISDIEAEDIKLLVGADIPSALLATEVKVGKKNMPYATKTPFGWSLFGMFKQNDNSWSEIEHSYHVSVQNDLQNQVERFWSTEAFGTQFNMENSLSVEDNRALKELEDSTKFNNGHYEVSMLWADKSFVMTNNYHISSRRLKHLV